jgi:hypothetical protein
MDDEQNHTGRIMHLRGRSKIKNNHVLEKELL